MAQEVVLLKRRVLEWSTDSVDTALTRTEAGGIDDDDASLTLLSSLCNLHP